MIIRNRI